MVSTRAWPEGWPLDRLLERPLFPNLGSRRTGHQHNTMIAQTTAGKFFHFLGLVHQTVLVNETRNIASRPRRLTRIAYARSGITNMRCEKKKCRCMWPSKKRVKEEQRTTAPSSFLGYASSEEYNVYEDQELLKRLEAMILFWRMAPEEFRIPN